jgi:hypothetical protein
MDLTDEQWEVLQLLIPRPPCTEDGRGQTLEGPTRCPERHPLDTSHRRSLEGPPGALPTLPDLPPALSAVGRRRHSFAHPGSPGPRPKRAWGNRSFRVLHRWYVHGSQKRGIRVGKTKRGKGTKVMAVADGSCVPLAISTQRVLLHTRSPLLSRLWQWAL